MGRSQKHDVAAAFDFSGGLQTKYEKTSIGENEVADIENFHLEARGGLRKRHGSQFYISGDTAVSSIVGLHQFRNQAGTKFNIRIQGTAAHYDNAGVWTAITGAVTITSSANNRWVFHTFRGNAVGTNGVNPPIKWPGTGNFAAITQTIDGGSDTIDKFKTFVVHRERIVAGDVTATESSVQTRYESVIWPTDSGTLDTWSGSPIGKIHIGQGDGDSITCLLDVLGYLIVFKQHSLWRVENLGDFQNQVAKRVASVGTSSPHGAVVANNLVYFQDTEGRFWVYDPRGTDEDALVELSKDKLGPRTYDSFVYTRMPYNHAVYHPHNNEVWFFLCDNGNTTATNVVYVYNILTGGFTKLRFASKYNYSTVWMDANDHPTLIGGINGGIVLVLDEGTYDEAYQTAGNYNISAYVLTRNYDFGDPSLTKGLRDLDIYPVSEVSSDEVRLSVRKNFSSTGDNYTLTISGSAAANWDEATWGSDVWGGTDPSDSEVRTRMTGFARWWQFRLSHITQNDIKILGFIAYTAPAGERRVA